MFAPWHTGNQPIRMVVSGIALSASAVALLARRLQRAGHRQLADDVGLAVDANWDELVLASHEEEEILSTLHHCPAPLRPLRDELRANTRRRGKQTGEGLGLAPAAHGFTGDVGGYSVGGDRPKKGGQRG